MAGDVDASLIGMRDGVPSVVNTGGRLDAILVHDLEVAETALLSGVQVWISSRLFASLRDKMKRSVH